MVTQANITSSTPLGATLVPGGATFRIWAPRAQSVHIVGDFNAWSVTPADALLQRPSGDWVGFVSGLTENNAYKFWVTGPGAAADRGYKRDPFARDLSFQPAFPNSNCILRNPESFPWRVTHFQRPAFSDLIIYQCHVGTFSIPSGKFNGKFLDVADLLPYLQSLGINSLQLLPVVEFPTEFSMGYNGTDYFSPEMDYAEPDSAQLALYLTRLNSLLAGRGLPGYTLSDLASPSSQLKALIDVAHAYGIGVILDVVYNHAGGGFDDESLWFLDQLPKGNNNDSLYFTDQGWAGGLIFAYWNERVREFLQENAAYYLREYRVDGFRFDEVSVMDHFGGWSTCQQLTNSLRAQEPDAPLIAEYWPVNAYTVKPVAELGAGFDATWHDGLRDALRDAIQQASLGASADVDFTRLASVLQPSQVADSWRAVTCIENHDIVKGSGPRVARLADGSDSRSWYGRSRSRVANGILLTAPGIPMLFMGQEFLEDKSWSDNPNAPGLYWDGLMLGDRTMVDFLRFMQDLVALRRRQPALRSSGFRVLNADNPGRVLATHRWIPGFGRDVVVVASLRESTWYGYRIGFPTSGRWLEVFNSDVYDQWVNPVVAGNGGGVQVQDSPWQGMPASAEITIPANGILVFARDQGD